MLPESFTAILARNERWTGEASCEPYEAGWAHEAVVFIRALKAPVGPAPMARIEMSPDGIRWVSSGVAVQMPDSKDAIAMARVAHFGNWLRVATRFEDGAECTVLVTLHLKA